MLRQHNARYHATRLQAPYQPVVERALIPFTCAIWLATALQILHAHGIPGWSLPWPIATPDALSLLLQDGALYGPYVFAGGEVWRLLTSLFPHGPLLHVASTLLFLYILGVDLERFVGHLRWGAIYLGSGVLAGLFSAVVLHPL